MTTSSGENGSAHPREGAPDAQDALEGAVAAPLPSASAEPEPSSVEEGDETFAERLALLESKVAAAARERQFDDAKDDVSGNQRRSSLLPAILLPDAGADRREGVLQLPQSTFSLLITESTPCSAPSILALVTAGLSMTCLILALIYSLSMGNQMNPLGLPVDVSPIVRGAQFLGILIGVLMEDEIPRGLELIAISTQSSFLLNDKSTVYKRVLFSSTLRLIVGYLFLTGLFVNVVQTSDVLTCFFDVLALQFVESIDDVAFNLGMRGFFGSSISRATRERHSLQAAGDRGIASSSWVNRFVRGVYYVNAVVLLSGVIVISVKQHQGDYRCQTLTVSFDEVAWEDANIKHLRRDELSEPMLLIYPYFSGTYREEGTFNGYPRYREMNKNSGAPYDNSTVGAEFVYCKEINSWVFRHERIRTSLFEEKENECSWLARSPETEDFDLKSLEGKWSVWTGNVEDTHISFECNECWDFSNCNYHGRCVEKQCVCLPGFFGSHCHFEQPCPLLRSKVGDGCEVLSLEGSADQFKKIYNRPVYMKHNLLGLPGSSESPEKRLAFLLGNNTGTGGKDLLPGNYSMVLSYSGSRWYGSIMGQEVLSKFYGDAASQYHGFWARAFKRQNALIISDTTFDGSPVSSDFYLQEQRGDEEGGGAYGMLVPLADFVGSGLFVCVSENDCSDDPSSSNAPLPAGVSDAGAPPDIPISASGTVADGGL